MDGSLRVFLNGRILSLKAARIGVFDRGFLFGDGVYETMRAYSGRTFRLPQHLKRLGRSAARLGFRVPGTVAGMARAVRRTLAASRLREARVRIVVTRGTGRPDLAAVSGLRPNVFIYATPYAPPSPYRYRRGIRVVLAGLLRNDKRALDPAIKSLNLINNLLAKREAFRRGGDDAVMLNAAGRLTEATSANVFFVRRGVLCTPALSSGILPGITRELVMDLARRVGLSVREGEFRPTSLLKAEEAFLTASTIEILPIAVVGNRRLPVSRPWTRALQEAYRITVVDELGFADAPRSR